MSHEGGHGRIEAVTLLELQRQAFLEVAGEDAGRIAGLQLGENILDMGGGGSQRLGHGGGVGGEVARLVQHADEMLADQLVGGRGEGEMHLVSQVFGERRLAGESGIEVEALGIERQGALRPQRGPARFGWRRHRLAARGIGARLVGVDILEFGIQRAQALLGAGIGGQGRHHVGLLAALGHLLLHVTALIALEQRIALEFLVDEGLQFHVGHLQQLDGLLQLRRHDQGLALAKIEPLVQRHGLALPLTG